MASPTGPSRHEGSTSPEVLPSPFSRPRCSAQAEGVSASRPEMPRLPIS